MDKETLSNYGWIVICVLVLAVMIALATPFGNFIKDAVWSTVNGLFDVQNNALDSAGIFVDKIESPESNLTESASASGSYIVVTDASPTPHNLNITLSSDTITDFSSVNLYKYGNNLLDISQMTNESLCDNGDGTYTYTRIDTKRYSNYCDVFIPANTPLCLMMVELSNTTFGPEHLLLEVQFDDDSKDYLYQSLETKSFEKNIVKVRFIVRPSAAAVGESITFEGARLNVGSVQPYEAYVAPTIISVPADGNVAGVKSLNSSYFTLLSDSDNVNITCEYSKKKQ